MAAQALLNDPERARLATVLDWWFIARVGEQLSGEGWTIDHKLPAHLGGPLRRVLEAQQGDRPPISVLRAPIRFRAALEAVERLTDRDQLPNLRKTPGPALLGEALQEAQRLVEAGRRGDPRPPPGLRIVEGDDEEIESWASETREGQALQRGLKVWYPMVRVLRDFADAARALAAAWCVDPLGPPLLPDDWRATVRTEFGEDAPLVEACLHPLDWRDWDGHGVRPQPPELLRPEWLLAELGRVDAAALGPPGVVRLLPLAREAAEAAPKAEVPGWVADAEDHWEQCVNRVEALQATTKAQGVDEAAQWLDMARDLLGEFDVSQAGQAIESAVQALGQRGLDPRLSRLDQEAAGWQADLERIGRGPETPARPSAEEVADRAEVLVGWHAAVKAVHVRARDALAADLQLLRDRAASLPQAEERAQARRRLELLSEALERGELARAETARQDAGRYIEAQAREAESRLLPELQRLAARVREAQGLEAAERAAMEALVQRIGNRAALGLGARVDAAGVEALLRALEAGTPFAVDVLAVVTDEHLGAGGFEAGTAWLGGVPGGAPAGPALRVLCWADSAVPLAQSRVPTPDRRIYLPAGTPLLPWTLVRLTAAALAKAPAAGARWVLEAVPDALPDDQVTELVMVDRPEAWLAQRAEHGEAPVGPTYVVLRGAVEGPWQVAQTDGRLVGGPHPYRVRLSEETLHAYFGTLRIGWMGQDEQRVLLLDEPAPRLLIDLGGTPVDSLDANQLGSWLHKHIQTLSRVEADELSATLIELEELPPTVREARAARFAELFESSRWLVQARRQAALAFLETEEGAREKDRAAERAVQAMRTELQARMLEEQRAAEAELARLHQRIDTLAAEESELRRGLEGRLAQAREEAETYEGLAKDGRARALLTLMGAGLGSALSGGGASAFGAHPGSHPSDQPGAAASGHGGVDDTPLVAPAVLVAPPQDVRALAKDLEGRLVGWQAHEVSNLLLTLLTSPWTLLAGPPGVGKSTLARTLLAQLGATPANGRAVEVVVRREWQDDAAVFGFLHPQRDAWSPGDVGLLELLLRAASAPREGNNALFGVLLEELNLAAPEYYLARLLSALETPDPEVSLYGDDLRPRNRHRYPSRFPVGPNVRLLGSVNVDDTVERLSPRFLSRAAVVWFEPTLDEMLERREEPRPPSMPVDWASAMAEVMATPDAELGDLRDILTFLHARPAISGAPTPRAIRAVLRYLAVAKGVLPLTVAQDHCVLQRFLPGLRGVGEAAGEAFAHFERLLSDRNLVRSAQRVGQMRRRGESVGHFYDLFHG